MFRNLFIITALLILTVAAPAHSQENTEKASDSKKQEIKSAAPELSLDQVLENYYKAIGGLENWKEVKTMSMGGVMVSMGQSVPIRALYMRPNKCKVEYKVKDAVIIQAFDGKMGWQHNPHGEVILPQPMSTGKTNYLRDTCEIDGPIIDYKKKGNKIELLGTETLYGNETYKVKITYKTGNVQTYFLDSKTFLPVRLDGVYQLDGLENKITTSYFDYKKIGKLVIPSKLNFDIVGSPGTEEVIFKTVQVNPRISESSFKKPD